MLLSLQHIAAEIAYMASLRRLSDLLLLKLSRLDAVICSRQLKNLHDGYCLHPISRTQT